MTEVRSTPRSVVVFKDGSTEPVTPSELKILRQCGLLAKLAVNDRWHTDERALVLEILGNVRYRTVMS